MPGLEATFKGGGWVCGVSTTQIKHISAKICCNAFFPMYRVSVQLKNVAFMESKGAWENADPIDDPILHI